MPDMSLAFGLQILLMLICSIAIHEWAHAYTADKLGDYLPRSQGRVTLNPMAHVDIIGTVIIPLIGIFQLLGGFFLIGWGKPVQIDPRNFKHRVRDDLLVTAAGPLSNIILAFIGAIVGGVFIALTEPETATIFIYWIQLNCVLVLFNLLPIPPLDGSHFMRYAVGMSDEAYMKLSSYGWIFLLIFINVPFLRQMLGAGVSALASPFYELMVLVAGLVLALTQ